MSLLSGNTAVPGNAASVIVTLGATVVLPYQVAVSASWASDHQISGKVGTQFVDTFTVAAPAAGGTLDWFISGVTTLATGSAQPVSDADIASDALAMLGEAAITSLDDDSDAARVMKRLYPKCRDAVLRAHPWNFAQVRTKLVALTTKPAFAGEEGFTFYFQLPTDPYCLRVMETDGDEDEEPWRVEGRTIISTQGTMSIVYVAKITDPTVFDSLFVAAFRARLAAEAAYAITGQSTLQDRIWSLYTAALKEARTVDGQEEGIRRIRTRSLSEVR